MDWVKHLEFEVVQRSYYWNVDPRDTTELSTDCWLVSLMKIYSLLLQTRLQHFEGIGSFKLQCMIANFITKSIVNRNDSNRNSITNNSKNIME